MSIGLFDSGIGGLTVMKQIIREFPNKSIVYFGDTLRVPYGNKSEQIVKKFSIQISKFLLKQDIEMLIIACNTATSYALKSLAEILPIPVIGVINPGAMAAKNITKNKKIGVIGTKGTINSKAYEKSLKALDNSIEVFQKACPLFVPLVEENLINDEITFLVTKKYLEEFKSFGIDTLILGCTHYPIIKNVISKVLGENVNIIDSAIETAKVAKSILKNTNDNKKFYKFFVTDYTEYFLEFTSKILNLDINNIDIQKVSLED